ncbi:toxin RelE [Emticicia aquatilis]|uniref:Toxin RelE n=1 Tax=Emticicia aquatilis TaxID=1537369 RepID=A0A916YDG2_9BACT|nr:type II toxin-antitoxin system RelE/ParE family toxin [Emticicia aquatilis]GGD41064.1 toxin RelE [Emticicia aquatilis]
MKIVIKGSFVRDAKKLGKEIQLEIKDILLELEQVDSLSQIKNLKKMTGYKNAYRIRLGNYRIGFLMIADELILSRVLHRKDIYDYFPD